MSMVLPKSAFLHIPKTGGSWVGECLRQLGLAKDRGIAHLDIEDLRALSNKPIFTFVRNPVTWYQSRWSDRYARLQWQGRLKNTPLNYKNEEELNDFCVWMRGILDRQPNFVTNFYKQRLGSSLTGADIIGKTENLRQDLIHAMTVCGEEFSTAIVDGTPKVNEAGPGDRRYTPKLLKRVIEAEIVVLDHFGYPTNVAEYERLLK